MFVAAEALLGGIFGLSLKKIKSIIYGKVTMAASSLRKFTISSFVLDLLRISPGTEAPRVIDIRFARTARKTVLGIDSTLNQFVATLLGELTMKMLPMAAKSDPTRHQIGFSYYKSVLSQTPPIRNAPPTKKPFCIPYFSKNQLQGNAMMG